MPEGLAHADASATLHRVDKPAACPPYRVGTHTRRTGISCTLIRMSRHDIRHAIADRFSDEARRFVEWADGTSSSQTMSASVALRRVVALYGVALELPQPWSEKVSTGELPCPDLTRRLAAV